MGHIINRIRIQQRTALLNREAMEREQRREQGYPAAFPVLDGDGGIKWVKASDSAAKFPCPTIALLGK